jgi:hypothetical protein
VRTLQCCQHDSSADSAWIQFEHFADAEEFMQLIIGTAHDDLFDRQRDWEIATPEPSDSRRGWRWKAAPTPAADGGWTFDVMVEFPAEDIVEIARRLRASAAGGAS